MISAHANTLVTVRLSANISYEGVDMGPDFGTPIAELPESVARVYMQRDQARVAFLGPCSRETRRCDTATAPQLETAPCCVAGAIATLRKCAELFDRYGVTWWADYGTLLGVAHGEQFYWNDKDCDVGVLSSDLEKVLRMQELFERDGFTFNYQAPRDGLFAGGNRVKVRWSKTNTVNTDVFFWQDRGGTMYRTNYVPVDRYKGREFPRAWLDPIGRVPFEGVDLAVPAEVERLVAHRYGPGWRKLPPALHGALER